mmetsp:Transcript_34652/g.78358  ORF Transcript_34652/g.78358 Transcript_34652/m.78358 type:complete len:246 (+) Transcript_34652:509-1246(+)
MGQGVLEPAVGLGHLGPHHEAAALAGLDTQVLVDLLGVRGVLLGLPHLAPDEVDLGHGVEGVGPERWVLHLLCELQGRHRRLFRLAQRVCEFSRLAVGVLLRSGPVEHRKIGLHHEEEHVDLERLVLVLLGELVTLGRQLQRVLEPLGLHVDSREGVEGLDKEPRVVQLLEDLLRFPHPLLSLVIDIDLRIHGAIDEKRETLSLRVAHLLVELLRLAGRVQGLCKLVLGGIRRGEDVQQHTRLSP